MTPCILTEKNREDEFQRKSVEQCWTLLNGTVMDMCEKYIPKHRVGYLQEKADHLGQIIKPQML